MIFKVQPNTQKAESLMSMARITLQRLQETDTIKYPSNTLVDYYESMHKLMDAIITRDGFTISGKGAHQKIFEFYHALKGVVCVDFWMLKEHSTLKRGVSRQVP